MGEPPLIIQSAVTATIAVFALGVALQGYYRTRLSWIERLIAGLGALLLILPDLSYDLLGAACVLAVYLVQRYRGRVPAVAPGE
jgi:TRAP-type uncharacterized transport system fused permease subunit